MALCAAHAGGLLLMLQSDNFNICHWTKGDDLKQHPDPNKDSQRKRKAGFQTYDRPVPALKCERSLIMLSAAHCAADVQTLILFSLKAQEQGPLSLQCFVTLFLLFFCYRDFTKGGRTGERVPTRGRPPEGVISPCLAVALRGSHERKQSGNLCFCMLSSLY